MSDLIARLNKIIDDHGPDQPLTAGMLLELLQLDTGELRVERKDLNELERLVGGRVRKVFQWVRENHGPLIEDLLDRTLPELLAVAPGSFGAGTVHALLNKLEKLGFGTAPSWTGDIFSGSKVKPAWAELTLRQIMQGP